MCDFKPGDEIVCVRDGMWSPDTFQPRVHEVYVVATVELDCGEVCITLREGDKDDMFRPEFFRKVERRTDKLSLTEWLSQPAGDTDRLDKTRPAKTRERA